MLRAESGTVEVDSIEFVPYNRRRNSTASLKMEYGPILSGELHPVGGKIARSHTDWDSMIDPASGVSIAGGAAGTTAINTRWLFDVSIGSTNCGVLLAQSYHGLSGHGLNAGYMVIRSGADLIIRQWNGTATDTTVTGVFAATGMVRCLIEVDYDAATGLMQVYVDGTARGAAFTPAWKHFAAGLVTGATAGAAPYASGQYSVCRTGSGETI